MERGRNKFKYVILLVSILIISMFVSCKKEEEISFENNNTIFFQNLLARKERDEIEIEALRAYYYEGKYFYDVEYSYNDQFVSDWTKIELIYVYNYTELTLHFNIKEGPSAFTYWYDLYNNATEKGVKKEFTIQEIEILFDAFYAQ